MSSSIADPFLLASYGLSPRETKGKGKAVEDYTHVFASYCSLPHREDGQVVIAAQEDGVHIIDLAGLHPVSSHTLGPSTSFVSSPAIRISLEDEHRYRYTYVAIKSASDIDETERGRVVWSWRESLSEELGNLQAKRVFKLESPISEVFAPESLPDTLILITDDGDVIMTDSECSEKYAWRRPTELGSEKILKTIVLPRKDCNFISSKTLPANGSVILLFSSVDTRIVVRAFSIGSDSQVVVLDPITVSAASTNPILDISCGSSGYATVLDGSGVWSSYRLEISDSTMTVANISAPLSLVGLAFVEKSAPKSESYRQASLLALNSSYVLLAGVTSDEVPEVALLLWDMQYGVLIHSHKFALPSTLDKTASVKISSGSASQAILVLSPSRTRDSGNSPSRTSVLSVPFTVSSTSSIASVLGKASQGSRWLAAKPHQRSLDANEYDCDNPFALDAEHEELLQTLLDAVEEERATDADQLFFDWVQKETLRLKAEAPAPAPAPVNTQPQEDAMDAEEEDAPKKKIDRDDWKPIHDTRVPFSYSFVIRLLRIFLPAEYNAKAPYSPKVLRYLLERKVVSSNMIEGGLISALLLRKDWDSIYLSFKRVIDLNEDDIIRSLHNLLKSHQEKAPDADDAMAVDRPKYIPDLSSPQIFLAFCVATPTSPPTLRKTIKEYFPNVEDLMQLLLIIDGWITEWISREIFFAFGEVTMNENGVPVAKVKTKRKKAESLPDLDKLMLFLQAILDSSFLKLLHHTPSHEVLQHISTNLSPQVAFNQDLELLRGPLLPFAKAQSKALADARGDKKNEEAVDWRKRRKQLMDQDNLSVKQYQIEELVF